MKIAQRFWTARDGWELIEGDEEQARKAQLVFAFGGRKALEEKTHYEKLQVFFPNAQILTGSTAGEIIDVEVHDDSIVATGIQFEHTQIETAIVPVNDRESYEVGKTLAGKISHQDLKHIFILSDGGKVNGTDLIRGFKENVPTNVTITGGLAGDAANFSRTLVGLNAAPDEGNVACVGFYGDRLKIGFGSVGGWDPFGPDRIITKSDKNVLHELDGKPALELYKTYLGEQAEKLPGSALLFPLSMRKSIEDKEEVVRTILTIDEAQQTMTFAGDLPEGNITRLMKANFDRLVDGAHKAAEGSVSTIGSFIPELALLISCVGRKLVLGQRIEDEVESVREVIGDEPIITGFYSYGEIAPSLGTVNCKLHNQTMTITLMAEE
ncbi:MAG: FIST signal transduction protein [Flammeovirgaceae bacterium]